eukprot:TRINITY_DN21572_c0_g1_i2.p1 TRINITY_DN21572_c0_g1~~TRINITY_DN21572_c0_g1_i2.p1  ORF type:complete len:359 (+),score=88.71 TRINITY_DN21572_c0_g1_i2:324-1400(+)
MVMFCFINFLKDFPIEGLKGMKPHTKDMILNCGFHIASMFQAQEKIEQAIDALRDLERLFPSVPVVPSAMGACYRELGDMETALKCFRKAYDSNPDHAETVLVFAKALLSTNNKDNKREAIRVLKTATNSRFSEAPSEIYMLYAQTMEDLKQFKPAIDAVKKVISLEPRNANARVHLAKLYLKTKQYAPAAKLLVQARDMQPYDSEAALLLGTALYRLQKLESAEKAVQDALVLNPSIGQGEAHKLLGKLYGKQNKWEDASFHFESLISMRSSDPEAYIRGANADEHCSRTEEANSKLARAVEIWSSKPPAFFNKHPEDLKALKGIFARCGSKSGIPDSFVCSQIQSILEQSTSTTGK